jgi:K+-sensing histidine kinase KdpD
MMRAAPAETQSPPVGWLLAGLGPIAVAAVLVPVREDLDNTNLALILVVVVVVAASVGGRGPAVLAALISTASYDFFLTRPYLTLTIDDADDVETAIILLVIGLIVGQLVVVGRRRRSAAERGSDEVHRLHEVAEQVAAGASEAELVAVVEGQISGLLGLRGCTFERGGATGVPHAVLNRNGAVEGAHGRRFLGRAFALPADGVSLPVLARGQEVGRLVLEPDSEHGVTLEERVVAVIMADLLGATLASRSSHS